MADIIRTSDDVQDFIQLTLDTSGDTFLLAPGVSLISTVGGFLSASATGVRAYFDGYFYIGNFGQSVYLLGNDRVEIGSTGRLLLGSAADYLGIQLGSGLNGPSIDPVGGTSFTNRGEITVPDGGGVGASGGSNQFVNDGTITAASNGVELGRFGGVGDSFLNCGTVTATRGEGSSFWGHGVTLSGSQGILANEGSIAALGQNKAAVRLLADGNEVVNAGTLTALRGYGILDTGGFLGNDVTNTGTVTGLLASVFASNGSDSLTNRGLLDGDVFLNGGSDTFDGRRGSVDGTVFGGAGDDTFRISDDGIVLSEAAGEGTDTVFSSVSHTLGAEFELLRLSGAGAIDGTGNEVANVVEGNGGDNRLAGLGGADTLTGAGGDDTLDGGKENDQLYAGGGADRLLGRGGNDLLSGGTDEDRLFGGAGNDTLQGGDDDDTLQGGAGRDRLEGGSGADRFEFVSPADSLPGNSQRDLVLDFTAGEDVIDLSAIDARPGSGGNQAFAFLGTGAFTGAEGQLRLAVSGANLLLQADLDGNGAADLEIQVNGLAALALADLVL